MNKNKLQSMEREFPFLKSFLTKNFGAFLKDKTTTLDIKVQRMDPNILFYVGDHLDGHQSRFIKEKHYGSLFTSFFFIDDQGETILRNWGILHDYALIHLLKSRKFRNTTHIVVKAEIETWYEWQKNENGDRPEQSFCHFSHREINMTIYKAPEEGVAALLSDPHLATRLRLNTRLLMNLMFNSRKEYDEIQKHLDELKNAFKPFFERHLQAPMHPERAFNCVIDGITFLSLSMAGRLLITLDTPASQISYMALDEASGDSRIGVNSVEGTLEEITDITSKFIASCEKLFNEGKTFHDIFTTGKVGFAGNTFGK